MEQNELVALSPGLMLRPARPWLFALSAVALVFTALLIHGWPHRLMPLDNEWGETVLALHAADQYRQAGIQFGLLENLRSVDDPLLYTHNVNIGNICYVLLEAAGVRAQEGKQVFTLLIFAVGLYFVYLCVAKYTGSGLCGLIVLALFCLDYRNVLAFGYNGLRAWHWFALFGMLYATRTWQEAVPHSCHSPRGLGVGVRARPWLGLALLTVSAFAAFGCGYDFFIICAMCALGSLIFFISLDRGLVRTFVPFSLVLALPFMLRQIQVAAVMGLDFWWQDFCFSFAIKVPFGSRFIHLPPLEEVDHYYQAHNVLRPASSPAPDLAAVLGTFWQMLTLVTIPSWGLLTVVLHALMVGGALLAAVLALFSRRARPMVPWAGLILSLCLGTYAGLYLLAPFSLHVYMKHQFPLLAAALLVPKGIFITLLVAGIRHILRGEGRGARGEEMDASSALAPPSDFRSLEDFGSLTEGASSPLAPSRSPLLRLIAIGLAAALLGCLVDLAATMVRIQQSPDYFDVGWVEFAPRALPGELAIPDYYQHPRSPPVYDAAAEKYERICYNPSDVRDILDGCTGRVRHNVPRRTKSFFQHCQTFASGQAEVKYLLYQPTDRWCPFDAVAQTGTGAEDYLYASLHRLAESRLTVFPTSGRISPWDNTAPPGCRVAPGSVVSIDIYFDCGVPIELRDVRLIGRPAGTPEPKAGTRVAPDEPTAGIATLNRVFKVARFWYQTEAAQDGQTLELDVQGIFADGDIRHLRRYVVDVRRGHPLVGNPPAPSQPSVEALIALYPEVPIVARGRHGVGYVIFDIGAAKAARQRAKLGGGEP